MLLLLIFSFSVYAATIPDATDTFYVNDYTGSIPQSVASAITEKCAYLEEQTGAQIVVVLLDGLGGADTGDYAYKLFNTWKIGDAKKNNGLLFLMSEGDDDYYALQGKGLEKVISSADLSAILDDEVEPFFKEKDYGGAAEAFVNSTYKKLCAHYGISETPSAQPENSSGSTAAAAASAAGLAAGGMLAGFFGGVLRFIGIVLVIIIIVVLAMRFSMPRRTPYSRAGGFFFAPRRPRRPPYGGSFYGRRPPSPPPPRSPRSGGGRPSNPFGPGSGAGRSFGSRPSSFGGSSRPSSGGRSSFGGGSRSGGGGSSRGGGAGRGRR